MVEHIGPRLHYTIWGKMCQPELPTERLLQSLTALGGGANFPQRRIRSTVDANIILSPASPQTGTKHSPSSPSMGPQRTPAAGAAHPRFSSTGGARLLSGGPLHGRRNRNPFRIERHPGFHHGWPTPVIGHARLGLNVTPGYLIRRRLINHDASRRATAATAISSSAHNTMNQVVSPEPKPKPR